MSDSKVLTTFVEIFVDELVRSTATFTVATVWIYIIAVKDIFKIKKRL